MGKAVLAVAQKQKATKTKHELPDGNIYFFYVYHSA